MGELVCRQKDDSTVWEREPLENLASEGKLVVFRHEGFWQAMDTARDMALLESIWRKGEASWRVW